MGKAFSFSAEGTEGSAGNRGVFRDATALHTQEKTHFTTASRIWEGGVTESVHVWSPDSLREILSHVPHQSAAPVVTHQGDPWYQLQKGQREDIIL